MTDNFNASVLSSFTHNASQLLEMEKEVLEMIAMGRPLKDILEKIALNFEANTDQAFCSILLVDEEGKHVLHGAAPSLPDAYNNGINGEPIGPLAGSCGTAVFRKKRVIVSDIAANPLWINYRDFALSYGLKACWSTPVIGKDGKVLGTFAIYYKTVKEPTETDLNFIDRAASQVKIVLEQHIKETLLKESEERYRTNLERITDGFVALDKEWRFTYLNKRAGEIFGFSPEKMIGQFIHNQFKKEAGEVFFEAYEKSMRDQKYIYLEGYYSPLESWFENHVYPSPDGLSIYFRDITNRKESELQLLQIKESLELAEEQAKLGNWELNVKSKERKWSKQLFRLFGLSPGTDPLPHDQLITLIHADDRSSFERGLADMVNGREPKATVIRTNPEKLPLKYLLPIWYVERNEKGKATKFIGTLQDITDRVNSEKKITESEERYRTLVEQAGDGIFIADENLRFVQVNKMACSMLGYSSSELLGMSVNEVVRIEYDEPELRIEELAIGKTLLQERKLVKKDNSLVQVEVSATKMKDGNMLSIVRDVSEREQAHERIKEYNVQLRKLTTHLQDVREEERASLSRELHDELGQQLTGIKMDLSWLKNKISTSNLISKIEETISLTNEAVTTVRRINSGLRPTLLDDLGLIAALEYQANEFKKRFKISCDFSDELGEVQINQQYSIAIFRIFQEALTNVAKHSQASKVQARIGKNGPNLELVISDNGNGFNSKKEAAAVHSFGILGMTERAMMMGGDIEINSFAGKGTVVSLTVPLV